MHSGCLTSASEELAIRVVIAGIKPHLGCTASVHATGIKFHLDWTGLNKLQVYRVALDLDFDGRLHLPLLSSQHLLVLLNLMVP